jgi:hypothetical protein
LAAKLNAKKRHRPTPMTSLARVNSDLVGKYINIASRPASCQTLCRQAG